MEWSKFITAKTATALFILTLVLSIIAMAKPFIEIAETKIILDYAKKDIEKLSVKVGELGAITQDLKLLTPQILDIKEDLSKFRTENKDLRMLIIQHAKSFGFAINKKTCDPINEDCWSKKREYAREGS